VILKDHIVLTCLCELRYTLASAQKKTKTVQHLFGVVQQIDLCACHGETDKPMVEMRRLQGLTSSGHLIPVPPNNPLSHTPDVPWLACLDEQYIQLDEYQYVGLTAGGCIGTQRSD
jgi:hypothetical protein